ncbi:major facilitator superfamily protein [Wolffia australiana]
MKLSPGSRFRISKSRTKMKRGVSISLVLINLAAVLERADENLLPSVYKEVSEAFRVGPTELGYLTFARNFVQALASPLAGVLVLRYDRPAVLAMGTVCWALSTAAVGLSQRFGAVAFWRAVNGLGLAVVIPALQSFVADSYGDGARGTGFGVLSFVGSVGGIGGGALATVMAGQEYWGLPGWRCAFLLTALLSLLIGLLIFLFVDDPRKLQVSRDGKKRSPDGFSASAWEAARDVAKVRSFQIIALQGIVGSFPWTAMVFLTMWFELIGFDNRTAAGLISLLAMGCAVGAFLGGYLGDRVSGSFSRGGRIMLAQFSVFVGVPFSWCLFRLIPQAATSRGEFAAVLLLMGLTISWPANCANNPIFAEIVPARQRTMVYAFDRAVEGGLASLAAPAVGFLAERVFGYGSGPGKAAALSKGLLLTMALPWCLCGFLYSPLYFTLERDQAAAKEQELIPLVGSSPER